MMTFFENLEELVSTEEFLDAVKQFEGIGESCRKVVAVVINKYDTFPHLLVSYNGSLEGVIVKPNSNQDFYVDEYNYYEQVSWEFEFEHGWGNLDAPDDGIFYADALQWSYIKDNSFECKYQMTSESYEAVYMKDIYAKLATGSPNNKLLLEGI